MKVWKTISVFFLVLFAYLIGLCSGYVVGYNDKYSTEVVKYRIVRGYKR